MCGLHDEMLEVVAMSVAACPQSRMEEDVGKLDCEYRRQ
jgi:hypothetical protein